MKTTVKTLDLFHGAGGSSIGARMAGCSVIGAIDNWDIAHKCYSMNFPETLAVNAGIREVSPEHLHQLIGNVDLIIASPECTSHSCAKGRRGGSELSKETAFQVLRFAAEFMPRWIVVENVIQMASWNQYQEFLSGLRELGYYITEEKLNSNDFGVPQSRRRLFLLCSLTGQIVMKYPSVQMCLPASSVISLNGRYSFTPLNSPKRAQATIRRAQRAISALGADKPFLVVYYSTDGSGGWQSVGRPLRTVTTVDRFAYVKPSPEGHVMRMLQPEELKLAMGFPASYQLIAPSRRDKIKLVGNAVCPPVMKHLIMALLDQQSPTMDLSAVGARE